MPTHNISYRHSTHSLFLGEDEYGDPLNLGQCWLHKSKTQQKISRLRRELYKRERGGVAGGRLRAMCKESSCINPYHMRLGEYVELELPTAVPLMRTRAEEFHQTMATKLEQQRLAKLCGCRDVWCMLEHRELTEEQIAMRARLENAVGRANHERRLREAQWAKECTVEKMLPK